MYCAQLYSSVLFFLVSSDRSELRTLGKAENECAIRNANPDIYHKSWVGTRTLYASEHSHRLFIYLFLFICRRLPLPYIELLSGIFLPPPFECDSSSRTGTRRSPIVAFPLIVKRIFVYSRSCSSSLPSVSCPFIRIETTYPTDNIHRLKGNG